MKFVFLVIVAFHSLLQSHAQDVAKLIREADLLEAAPDEKAAFAKFKEVLQLQPINIYALNKCSELCSRIGKRMKASTESENYYAAAKTYAAIALKVNPNNSESNCVMAIALGRSSLNKSGKEKINSAREVRKYVDAAIKNDPRNFKAWHVLGRWHYEMSSLNSLERTAVKLFYGGVPPSSLQESINAFEKAQSITDGFILNYFEMARAYYKNNQRAKAIAVLSKMLSVANQTEDDPGIKEDGEN